LTPWILRIGFIVGILVLFAVGIYDLFVIQDVVLGLLVILTGPIFLRLILEVFMVYFTINETLTDIRNILKQKD
jgi:hypothetical protein